MQSTSDVRHSFFLLCERYPGSNMRKRVRSDCVCIPFEKYRRVTHMHCKVMAMCKSQCSGILAFERIMTGRFRMMSLYIFSFILHPTPCSPSACRRCCRHLFGSDMISYNIHEPLYHLHGHSLCRGGSSHPLRSFIHHLLPRLLQHHPSLPHLVSHKTTLVLSNYLRVPGYRSLH